MESKYKPKKYKLDLSAGFYPYVSGRKAQSLFCVSAVLTDTVDRELLTTAVNEVMGRFPLYKVCLKKGYGEYYLKENFSPVPVFEWNGRPQTPIDPKVTNGYRFRLSYEGERVYLEMFHALTDANGAMRFLLSILRRYRELTGVEFEEDCAIPTADGDTPVEELEDSFLANYERIPLSQLNLKGMAGGVPHRVKGDLLEDSYQVDEMLFFSPSLLEKAKAAGVTVTAYIAGVTAYSIAKGSQIKHPIEIMIPVNLRNIFPSVTAHNFITFVRLTLRSEDCVSLEKCFAACSEQLTQKVTKKSMQEFISTTVRAQRNPLFRAVPLCVKWVLIRFGRLFLKSRQTIIVSNLGNVKIPAELGVNRLSLFLNVSKNNVCNLAVTSSCGVCTLAFTRAIEQRNLSDTFLRTLESEGVEKY